jgi:DegV family protein with EDD domain
MSKVAIVTDSTTNIPKDLLKGIEVHVAPAIVIWSGEELRDGVDIQPTAFYERLAGAKEMPTTSQAVPGAFKDIYEKLVAAGQTDILSYHVSTKLSGTVNSAEQAKALVPDANVEIVDGLSCSMGTGWPLLEGIKAAKAGKSLEEVTKITRKASEKTGLFIMVDTLEFLHRGGRIGGASRFLGTALNLKPILELQEGALEAIERVRTKKKAKARLIELVKERLGGDTPIRIASLHANAKEEAEKLLEDAKEAFNPIEATITEVSPAVGTHTGPGTLGLAFMAGVD